MNFCTLFTSELWNQNPAVLRRRVKTSDNRLKGGSTNHNYMSLVVHVISPGMCSLWNIFTLFVFLFVCLHLQAVETCASGRIIRIYVLITELLKCNIQLYANIFKFFVIVPILLCRVLPGVAQLALEMKTAHL
jgi:hypothetical protein